MQIYLIILLLIFSFPATVQAKYIVNIAGVQSTKTNYERLVKNKGGNPLSIKEYNSPTSCRPSIALLVIQQALAAGGLDAELNFVSYPNIARSITEVKRGKIPVLATDMWEQDFDESVYKTVPFVRKGDFQKGVYTYKDSPLLDTDLTLDKLLKLIPLTENSWTIDINTLKKMGFQRMEIAPRYELLRKMINKKRADFTLFEFSRANDLIYSDGAGKLYPVKGIKIIFPYSRHFMVSKKHPDGKKIYEALEKGLKILIKNGSIERALYASGIKDKRVRDWKVIYP